jgi:S1-C subfamily serine protease
VAVHFLGGQAANREERFTVSKEQAKVVAIHRSADLAVIDVTAAAEGIEQRKIEAVQLAPRGHRPKVGEHVFAIGHPGGATLGC